MAKVMGLTNKGQELWPGKVPGKAPGNGPGKYPRKGSPEKDHRKGSRKVPWVPGKDHKK